MDDLSDDSNMNILNFTSIISDSIESFCPLKYLPQSVDSKKPWLSNDLKVLIKEKNKLYKKYLKKPITFEIQYRTIRNQVNNSIKTEKKKYYQNLLNQYQNNSKKSWSVLNGLLGRSRSKDEISLEINGELTENKETIVENFNNYFSNVTTEIVNSVPNCDISFRHFLQGSFTSSFFLSPISPVQIEYIIQNLKNTDGGYPNIPAKVFKLYSSVICEPLSITT